MSSDSSGNLFLTVAVIAFVASFGWVFFTLSESGKFTGFSTSKSNATVNVTVNSVTAINFTTNNINFGAGYVNPGSANVTLDTSTGTTTGGTGFTANSVGFVLENIGNTNVTLNISSGKTAASFLGGSNPQYLYNLSDIEAGSCLSYPSNSTFQTFLTGGGNLTCGNFQFKTSADTVRIDVRLVIPFDSITGDLGDQITATATSL